MVSSQKFLQSYLEISRYHLYASNIMHLVAISVLKLHFHCKLDGTLLLHSSEVESNPGPKDNIFQSVL